MPLVTHNPSPVPTDCLVVKKGENSFFFAASDMPQPLSQTANRSGSELITGNVSPKCAVVAVSFIVRLNDGSVAALCITLLLLLGNKKYPEPGLNVIKSHNFNDQHDPHKLVAVVE